MGSKFPKDIATGGLRRDPVSGAVLVNLDESAQWDREQTYRDSGTQGLLRDRDGAILAKVTGLPGSVVSAVNGKAPSGGAVTLTAADVGSVTSAFVAAGYARVVALPAANGTDDTEAINAILAAVTGPTIVRGVPGQGYKISGPLVLKSRTILDVARCSFTLLPGSNCNLLQNAQVVANNGRDTAIAVIGGTWDRGSNAGSLTATHSLCFRRVDGLIVRPERVLSAAGKYAINLGDVTVFDVGNVDLAVYSDGVHINGPASAGAVHDITGVSGDDSVAITCNDYANYADVKGDVTGVEIRNINTTSTLANIVKVLAGSNGAGTPYLVDDILVRRVRGSFKQNAVWLGDDNGQPLTDNGAHGTLIVQDVKATTTGTGTALVFGNLANGAKRIDISGVTIPAGQPNIKNGVLLGVDATGVIESLLVDRLHAEDGWGNTTNPRLVSLVCAAGAIVRSVEVRSPVALNLTNARLLEISGTAVEQARIVNPRCVAAGSTIWVSVNSSGRLGQLSTLGGQLSGGQRLLDHQGTGLVTRTTTVTTTANSTTMAGTGFTAADVGRVVSIPGAGASGATLLARINAVPSSTTATLAIAAGTAVSSVTATIYAPTELTLDADLTIPATIGNIATNRWYLDTYLGRVSLLGSTSGTAHFYCDTGSAGQSINGGAMSRIAPPSPGIHGAASGTGPQRVNGRSIVANLNALTPLDGDEATAQNAKGSINPGARCMAFGGVWKDLYSGVTG